MVIKKFLSRLQNHGMQIHILTLFLSLLLISTICIIGFSYFKIQQAILQFSKGTVERVAENVEEKILCNLNDIAQMPKLADNMIFHYHDFSYQNKSLIEFMLDAVKIYPNLHALFAGNPKGDFLEVIDRFTIAQKHYLSDSSKPLPKKLAYAIKQVNNNDNSPKETWIYMDDAFNVLEQETIPSDFDPRIFPWYQGAEKPGDLFWSPIYPFNRIGTEGITASYPMHNKKNAFIGVAGALLPLNSLSDFFTSRRIGKTGKALILDSTGKIILPQTAENSQALATMAYKHFLQKHNIDFILKFNGIEYLIHTHPFELSEIGWQILIYVPINDFFDDIFKTRKETILISLILLLLSSLIVYYLSKWISRPIVQLANEIDKIKHLNLQSKKRVKSHIKEINLLDSSIASMRVVLRSFGNYVPKEIVKQLLEKDKEIGLGGEKKEITIFFSDIYNFTHTAESLPIEIVMPALEAYFDKLSKIILEAQGTIDKYIGDSIMAFWGAPTETSNPEVRACTVALRCQAALAVFNQEQAKEQKPTFFTRIGIHTGEVIVGNIGTSERMNYTIMGDAVNEAARLEQVNKNYHTSIIISEEVYRKIDKEFLVRPLDEVFVKGKLHKIKIFELIAKQGEEPEIAPKPEQVVLSRLFTQAFDLYTGDKREEAKTLFLSINQKFPEDFPTKFYLDRLNPNN